MKQKKAGQAPIRELDLFLFRAFGWKSAASERLQTFTDSQKVASVGHCWGSVEYTVDDGDEAIPTPTKNPVARRPSAKTAANRIFHFSGIEWDTLERESLFNWQLCFRQSADSGRP